jgi:hypothetical protein
MRIVAEVRWTSWVLGGDGVAPQPSARLRFGAGHAAVLPMSSFCQGRRRRTNVADARYFPLLLLCLLLLSGYSIYC